MHIGDFIKQYREQSGMNMQEFADRAGLSKAYISILERNHNPRSGKPPIPSLETIRAVATVIGMDFNELIVALDGDQPIRLDSEPAANTTSLTEEEAKILQRIRTSSPEKVAAILELLK